MNRQEELILKSQSGDHEAAEQLVTENSGLIWSVVRRFLGRGVEGDDLYQLGCLGFLKAVDGFDLRFGTQMVDAKSLIGVLQLGVGKEALLTLYLDQNPDAVKSLLKDYILDE